MSKYTVVERLEIEATSPRQALLTLSRYRCDLVFALSQESAGEEAVARLLSRAVEEVLPPLTEEEVAVLGDSHTYEFRCSRCGIEASAATPSRARLCRSCYKEATA